MKLVIFGNSGSGKSTLAKALAQKHAATHLDLDTIAWQAAMVRASFEVSQDKACKPRSSARLKSYWSKYERC